MDDQTDETPELAKAIGVSGMRRGEKTQMNNTAKIHYLPILTLSQRCRAWRSIRVPRGNYKTPLPEDLREVV